MYLKPPFAKPRRELHRLPWRERMTLCVAAECKKPKRFFSVVVFATDFQLEGEVGAAAISRKLAMTNHESHPIMFAGTATRAIALAQMISLTLGEFAPPLDKENKPAHWDSILSVAISRQKYLIANEIVSSRFGLAYEEFLKNGKAALPEEIHRETVNDIAKASLDCWLLVLGFSMDHPTIYRTSPNGSVEICEHFGAIGSGYYIAEASLFQRKQSVENDLGTTIYNIYEAMKLGSIAPGVSDKFQIGVAEWDWFENPNPLNQGEVKISFLEPRYYDYLASRFKQYGPRDVSSVKLKPRLIKERYRALVLTPKGELDPEQQKAIRRAKAARDREAKKRASRRTEPSTDPKQ
jgi:hypothetical protein